ncbi:MAG: WbqC family protein, partial [Helicobacter sp.]|nr:WbqC family protein [Helicobacter sp.]
MAISQSNYIPWRGYFDLINSVDEFILYDTMQYTRRDWRNRNLIKTPQGVQWLSVPVDSKGKYTQSIDATKISTQSYKRKHLESLRHNYAKAPYFKEYYEWFAMLLNSVNTIYLSELNTALIIAINKLLGITTKITHSSSYILSGDKTERLCEICKQVGANEYISGPSAKCYMDLSVFKKANIEVKFFNYDNYMEYPQLYTPFVNSVSILDLIFNVGKNA